MKLSFRTIINITTLCLLSTQVYAGQWEYYIPLQGIKDVAFLNDKLYCAAGSGLFILDQNDFTYSRVTRVEGFPAVAANGIIQENDTTLLVATYMPGDTQIGSGIYRYNFNSNTWRLFDNPYPEGYRQQPYVHDMARDGDGNIWFIGDISLFKVVGDSLIHQTLGNGLPDTFYPVSLDVDKQGVLWMTFDSDSSTNIAKRENGTWKVMLEQSASAIDNLTLAPDGTAWFNMSNSLHSYNGSVVIDYDVGGSIPADRKKRISITSDNSIWCFTHEEHIVNIREGVIKDITEFFRQELDKAITPNWFFGISVLYANGNDLWVAASCGEVDNRYSVLCRYSEGKWSFFVPQPNLIYPYEIGGPDDIAINSDGSLWMAGWFTMFSQPVVQYLDDTWKFYTGNGTTDIAVDGANCLWLFGLDIRYLKNGEWTVFTAQDYPIFEDMMRAGTATSTQAWAGDGYGNVYRYKYGGEWIKYSSQEIGVDFITSIAVDDKRGVWVTGTKGAAYFDGDTWKLYTGSTIGLQVREWRHVAFGDNDIVWFSTDIGLLRFAEGVWKMFDTSNSGLASNSVNNVMISKKGDLWISVNGGLSRYDGAKWETFTKENAPLPSGSIRETAEAPDGSIWIVDGAGLCRYIPETITHIDNIKAQVPSSPIITGVYPNPFNPSTTIELTLPSSGKVNLVVYDITGRKVRELVSGQVSAGMRSVLWDGRDDSGSLVSSGVYFARLTMGKNIAVKKMLLMK